MPSRHRVITAPAANFFSGAQRNSVGGGDFLFLSPVRVTIGVRVLLAGGPTTSCVYNIIFIYISVCISSVSFSLKSPFTSNVYRQTILVFIFFARRATNVRTVSSPHIHVTYYIPMHIHVYCTLYLPDTYALQTSRIIIVYNIVILLRFNGYCEQSHYYDAFYR